MHALQAQPDGLQSRRVRAPAIHVPAELGDHPHHLAERGRFEPAEWKANANAKLCGTTRR
jgi:hypothetical protein